MSRPFYMPYAQFRSKENAEKMIHDRIEACNSAFENGEVKMIMNAVQSLENMLFASNIAKEDFLNEIKEIENDFKTKYDERYAKYKAQIEDIGCPDVISAPSKIPELEFWRRKFIVMWSLCNKLGLGLREKKRYDL